MSKVGLMVLALAEIGTGVATGERVSHRQLVAEPKSYLGKKIVVQSIGRVDNPNGRFVCVAVVGGQMLKVEASAPGAKTSQKISERLIGDCKGTANLTRATCVVDAEVEPSSAYKDTLETPEGTLPIAVIVAPQIEMYERRRR